MDVKELKLLQGAVAVELYCDYAGEPMVGLCHDDGRIHFGVAVYVVDAEVGDMEQISLPTICMDCDIVQFLGYRSAFGRIEAYRAIVSDIYCQTGPDENNREAMVLPLIPKGAEIVFLYDNRRNVACICSSGYSSKVTQFVKTDIFAKYDPDGKPLVKRRTSGTLEEVLLILDKESPAEEAIGVEAENPPEPVQPEAEAKAEEPEEPVELEGGGAPAEQSYVPSDSALSEEEIENLLTGNDLDGDKNGGGTGDAGNNAAGSANPKSNIPDKKRGFGVNTTMMGGNGGGI